SAAPAGGERPGAPDPTTQKPQLVPLRPGPTLRASPVGQRVTTWGRYAAPILHPFNGDGARRRLGPLGGPNPALAVRARTVEELGAATLGSPRPLLTARPRRTGSCRAGPDSCAPPTRTTAWKARCSS